MEHVYQRVLRLAGVLAVAATVLAFSGIGEGLEGQRKQVERPLEGEWLAGDFHQHTYYTDGRTTFDFVMMMNDVFDLDWWANSEHGGCCRIWDGNRTYWDSYVDPMGDEVIYNGHQVMWRWESLRDFVFPDILDWRSMLPNRKIASGVEWNVPGHEHCSVGIVAEDARAISAFEYMFDAGDFDTSRDGEATEFGTLGKNNSTHDDAVAACAWMQEQYEEGTLDDGWIVFAHIERRGDGSSGGYDINHFRDFNNAGPDVCFGFEGAPGHQTSNGRGGFGSGAFGGGTYGGTGYYTATIGHLWDALLGEGRRWFNFASSDYHAHHTVGGGDFYPGEYQKNYSFVMDADRDRDLSLKEIAQSLRSGNSFHVMGDLIGKLEFEASYKSDVVPMGGELLIPEDNTAPLKVKIRFSSPRVNHNGDRPVVDHIDVIAGDIYGILEPDHPLYSDPTNPTARILETVTVDEWSTEKNGDHVVVLTFKNPGSLALEESSEGFYLRLRGTNVPPGTPGETDGEGNPLPDAESGAYTGLNGAPEAWADLWFYSNPIFIYFQ